ncbi:MAG: HAD family hydrolase [Ruminococcaceae bacterium]|nr:HAD family hydrolase [Oscillospiraceae bacterium]
MKNYTHIAWDFNGTILNDLDASLSAANALLEQYSLPTLPDLNAYREVFGFPVINYYRRIGFDFDRIPYSVLAPEWVAYYKRFAANATYFPEIPAILEKLHQTGISQMIVTASYRGLIEEQLGALGIRGYFGELLALDNINAESKTALAARWRELNPNARPLFIGDTEHDLETARAMGADCLLVACGHRPHGALSACADATVLRDLNELSEWLNENIT